jgi:hypothetical protein
MTCRLLSLAALAPAILLHGCGGPLLSAEVKDASITSTNVPFAGAGVPGATALGSFTADLGPLGKPVASGVKTELTLTEVAINWTDPANRPDFSGVTSATLTAIPDPSSGLPPKVVATYVQDPLDPNPVGMVIAGDPALNLFDLLSGGVLDLRLDASGALPSTAWAQTATVVAHLRVKIEYTP